MSTKVLTEEQVAEKAAKLVLELEPLLEEKNPDGFKTMREMVKACMSFIEPIKGLDLKSVCEQVEKLKAKHEQLVAAHRSRKDGFYIPGLETAAQKFQLFKVFLARKLGWKEADAEFEYDVLKEVMKAHGDRIMLQKGQTIGNDEQGGNFVPDQVMGHIIDAIYTRSVLTNLDGEGESRIQVLTGLTGGNVRISRFEGGLVAYSIGEEEEAVESSAKAGFMTLNPKKVLVLAKLSQEFAMLASPAMMARFDRNFARAVAKKVDALTLKGTGGDNEPRGIFWTKGVKIYSAQAGALITATAGDYHAGIAAANGGDWTGGELDFDGLDNMDLAMEEDDVTLEEGRGFATIAPGRYYRRLKQLKVDNFSMQASNKPYLLGMPMLSDQKLKEFIRDFGKTNQLASNLKPGADVGAPSASGTTKHGSVLRGNLNTVLLGQWNGLTLEDDQGKGKGFTNDTIYVKSRFVFDIGIEQPRELTLCPDAKMRA